MDGPELSTCLNCGSPRAEAFCPSCGQRHVAAEAYDLKGLVVDYVAQVVSKLKLARTVWALARHPGRLTTQFMDGHRIEQVNPVWLFTFVWSTVVTFSQLVLTPESVDLAGVPPEMAEVFETIQPWFLGAVAYSTPFVNVLAIALVARVVLTKRWIEALVFGLHVGTFNILLNAPIAFAMARFGVWGSTAWVGYLLTILSILPAIAYHFLAFRTVFAARFERSGLRFAGYFLAEFLLEMVWTGALGLALWIGLLAWFVTVLGLGS